MSAKRAARIEKVATDKYDCPAATEEQRKQVEVLSEAQSETLFNLNDVVKKAMRDVQAAATPAA